MRDLVLLIDLDNTILDNDSVKKDIEARMLAILGPQLAARFWELYEIVRKDLDVIDFWEQMKRLKAEFPDNPAVDAAADALASWEFASRVYPRGIETVLHLKKMGMPIIVSDGDAVFQPTKIHRCGVTEAVDGRVLIFAHKEKHLPFVEAQFPAEHYVLIDDKPGILMRSKAALGDRLTTVHVLQGKYALDPKHAVDYKPDIVVQNFSDLLQYTREDFARPRKAAAAVAASGG
ncbi:MAG: HAD family hydrolase [Chloroflexi bacterium]|nr:HAD family hydrolase [Chloroflexota bacterium]